MEKSSFQLKKTTGMKVGSPVKKSDLKRIPVILNHISTRHAGLVPAASIIWLRA
jgi:hypothetical protein